MTEVSIIIPTLNEEGNVNKVFTLINEVFNSLKLNYEIIFVDDNSQDKTIEEIQGITNNNIKLINSPERLGLGYAIEQGMQCSNGKYIMFIDCDCSVGFDDVYKLVSLREINTLVIGSRYLKESSIKGAPKLKVLFSRVLNIMISRLFALNANDISHSFRIFHRCELNNFEVKTHPGFFWLLTYELMQKKYTLKETPIHFKERTVGLTKNMTKRMLFSVLYSVIYLVRRKYFA